MKSMVGLPRSVKKLICEPISESPGSCDAVSMNFVPHSWQDNAFSPFARPQYSHGFMKRPNLAHRRRARGHQRYFESGGWRKKRALTPALT